MDMPDSEENAIRFQEAMPENDVFSISALAGTGIDQLLSRILNLLEGD